MNLGDFKSLFFVLNLFSFYNLLCHMVHRHITLQSKIINIINKKFVNIMHFSSTTQVNQNLVQYNYAKAKVDLA